MTFKQTMISAEEMVAIVAERGYEARPNDYNGKILAYTLIGRRRAKKLVLGTGGQYSENEVKLACDGFDYANRSVARKRLDREIMKRRADPTQ